VRRRGAGVGGKGSAAQAALRRLGAGGAAHGGTARGAAPSEAAPGEAAR